MAHHSAAPNIVAQAVPARKPSQVRLGLIAGAMIVPADNCSAAYCNASPTVTTRMKNSSRLAFGSSGTFSVNSAGA